MRLYGAHLPETARLAVTVTVSIMGGYLFSLAHIPLAWMIGALVSSAVLSWYFDVSLPKNARAGALIVLGASFGTGITPSVLAQVITQLPWMILASVITLTAGAFLTRPLSAVAGLDMRTAFFCAVPGGVTVMPVLAESVGADTRPVTLSQTTRMVLVVVMVPAAVTLLGQMGTAEVFRATSMAVDPVLLCLFLAACTVAALGMKRVGAANPWILGPLFLSIAITSTMGAPSGFPEWLVHMAQVAMGAGLGIKLNRKFVLSSTRLLGISIATTMALGCILVVMSLVLAQVSSLPLNVLILGMAPGGTPEMVVTAAALHVAVPMVLAFHLVRMVASNVLILPMWKIVSRKKQRKA